MLTVIVVSHVTQDVTVATHVMEIVTVIAILLMVDVPLVKVVAQDVTVVMLRPVTFAIQGVRIITVLVVMPIVMNVN